MPGILDASNYKASCEFTIRNLTKSGEIALALKANKNVILLNNSELGNNFFKSLDMKLVRITDDPEHVIRILKNLLKYGSK